MRKIFVAYLFSSLSFFALAEAPINEIPMYGCQQKSEGQKKADELFIKRSLSQYGNLQKASEGYISHGWRYLQRGDAATAIKRFNQAWFLDSTNCDCYYGFAAYMRVIKTFEEEQRYLELAKKCNPNVKKYLNTFIRMYDAWKQWDMVVEVCELLLKTDSSDLFLLQKLGYAYSELKDTSNALHYLNLAITKDAKDSISYLNKGWLYYENGMYSEAIFNYSKAIEIQPTYISAYANRAEAYVQIKDFEKGILDYKKCIGLTPSVHHGQFYRAIGVTYLEGGNKPQGCEYLKQAMKMKDIYLNAQGKKGLKKIYKENCK